VGQRPRDPDLPVLRVGRSVIGGIDDTDLAESIDALHEGYLSFCRLLGADRGVAWGEDPEIAWVMTPIPLRGFNRITRIRLDAERADARIREMQDRFQTAAVAPTWWIDAHSTPSDIGKRLERMGLVYETVPAMRIESTLVPEPRSPAGVTLSWAVDRESIRAAMSLIATGFGMPGALGGALADLMAPLARPGGPVHTVVAQLDEIPVAAAQGILVGDAVAIFNVTTLEAARGRGIGAAVTLAVVRDAIERGARFGVLESSEMGLSVYRRIGFRDVGFFRVYAEPETENSL
jgi:ribosomal protein S18 acetylase RimI-like enzyme